MQNREKSKVLKDSCIYSTITHLFILWESSYMFLQLENSEVSLQAHFFRLVNITQEIKKMSSHLEEKCKMKL